MPHSAPTKKYKGTCNPSSDKNVEIIWHALAISFGKQNFPRRGCVGRADCLLSEGHLLYLDLLKVVGNGVLIVMNPMVQKIENTHHSQKQMDVSENSGIPPNHLF